MSACLSYRARNPSPCGRVWPQGALETPHPLAPLGPSPIGRRLAPLLVRRANDISQNSARKPSPCGRGWLRSSRVRGYGLPIRTLWLEARKRRPRVPRSCDIDRASNFLHHPIKPFHHFLIVKAQFEKSMPFNRKAARGVSPFLLGVVNSIELDGEPEFNTAKIDDGARDRLLATKFDSFEASTAQMLPKNLLRGGLGRAQATGDAGPAGSHILELAVENHFRQGLAQWRSHTAVVTPHPLAPLGPSPTGRRLAPQSVRVEETKP